MMLGLKFIHVRKWGPRLSAFPCIIEWASTLIYGDMCTASMHPVNGKVITQQNTVCNLITYKYFKCANSSEIGYGYMAAWQNNVGCKIVVVLDFLLLACVTHNLIARNTQLTETGYIHYSWISENMRMRFWKKQQAYTYEL